MRVGGWGAAIAAAVSVGCGGVAREPDGAMVGDPAGVIVGVDAAPPDAGVEIGPVSTSSSPAAPTTNHALACKPSTVKCDPTVPKGVRGMAAPPPGIVGEGVRAAAWDGRNALFVFEGLEWHGGESQAIAAHAATYDPTDDAWAVIEDPPPDALGEVSGANGSFFVESADGVSAIPRLYEWESTSGWRTLALHPSMTGPPSSLTWSAPTGDVLAMTMSRGCPTDVGCSSYRHQIFRWNDADASWTPRAYLAWDDSKYVLQDGVWIGDQLVFGDAWYDPVADTWSYVAPMPEVGGGGVTLPDCGSAALLTPHWLSPTAPEPSWHYWNPSTAAWEAAPEVPLDEIAFGVFGADDRFFVWGSGHVGAKGHGSYDPTGWVFTLSTGAWEKLPDGRPEAIVKPVWTGCDAIFVEPASPTPIAFRYRP